MRAPAARSGGAAGVSHDSPRAQTCTFEGPGLQKHQQNSTKGPQRERRMKRAKFWAVRRRVVRRKVVRRKVVQRKGPSVMECRVRVSGRKQKQNKNKMKRDEQEQEKSKDKHHLFDFGQLISTSANFEFGQFRLRPIRFRPAGRSRIVRSRIGRSRASSFNPPSPPSLL